VNRRNPPAKWVLPTVIDPPGRRCFIIEVPDELYHMAAFRGALLNLASAYKWQDDPAHTAREVANVWREIVDNVKTCPPDCDPDLGGTTLEDLMSQQIRISPDDSCVIQMWCIDHWEDWYNPTECIVKGSVQPPPAAGNPSQGETKTVCLPLQANSQVVLPYTVSGGYTLTVHDASGAATDGALGWTCPDGGDYVLGGCGAPGTHEVGDPSATAYHMSIIAYIDGVYYPTNAPIILPPDLVDEQVIFQLNDGTLSDNSGSLAFCVDVANNNQPLNSHFFDFTISAQGFQDAAVGVYNGVYVPGVGWTNPAVSNLSIVRYMPVGFTIARTKVNFVGVSTYNGKIFSSCFPQPCGGYTLLADAAPAGFDELTPHTFVSAEPVFQIQQDAAATGDSIVESCELFFYGPDPF
jgi:hypothetical protein